MRILALFGPTAVGKTGVAIAVADRLRERGEDPVAVNCDSIQVYRGLEVLSGAADAEQQQRLEHRLLSFVDPSDEFSAGRYAELAHAEIDSLLAEGRRPIVVGGTGLYLRAALADLDLRPPVPDEIRGQVERELEERGPATLHVELDPELAAGVDPNDRKRIARFTELTRAGIEPARGSDKLWTAELRHPTLLVGLAMARGELGERIDARVDEMVASAAADEARRAAAAGVSRTARAALGFEELLEGDPRAMKRAHRQYARRQLTWMRRMEDVVVVDRSARGDDDVADEIVSLLLDLKRSPIQIVRELNRWWARRDFETARELLLASNGWDDAAERFRRAGLEVDPIDPEVEVVVDAFPQGGVWIGQRGRDGWIQFWQAWVRPWRDFELEDQHYEQIGDHVLVEARVSARARDTAEVIETQAVQLFKVRNGLISLYAVYPNRDDALAAIRAE